MRLWSLHPKYLDAKGLVALWRETLLAKNVLEGKTKGYKNHPQLDRFKASHKPNDAINYYLYMIWSEATKRDYNFDKRKFTALNDVDRIDVTTGQLEFEKNHLHKKLEVRDAIKYNEILNVNSFETHPLFNLVNGEIEPWEKN